MSNNSQNEASVTPILLNTTENGLEDTYDDRDEFDENPSLCIPRVYKNITIPFIENVFQNKLCFGLIKKINIVPNNNDKNFKKVFIHFDFWYDRDEINEVKRKLLTGTTIKIIYDMPWFWKCSLNRYSFSNKNNFKNNYKNKH